MSTLTNSQIRRALASIDGHARFTTHPLTGGARITPAAGPFPSFPSAVPVGSRGAGAGENAGRSHFLVRGLRRLAELRLWVIHLFHGGNNA